MSEWWTKELSSLFPIPSNNDFNSFLISNFGLIKHNNIYMENFYFKDLTFNNIILNDLQCINYNDEIKKININHNNNVNKINNNDNLINKTKQTKIKTLETKKNRTINEIDSITKTRKIEIHPNNKQIKILNKWFKECDKVYNYCIKLYYNDKKFFESMNVYDKVKIFDKIYGNNDKKAPYDILTDEVRIFFSNLKSCKSNLKNGNIKHFDLKSKDISKSQSVFLPKTCINKNGFYISHLKNMKGFEKIDIDLKKINDSRLIYDKINKKYYLCLPYQEKIKEKRKKIRMISLDPGEKNFLSYFSEIGYGILGKNIRNKILPLEKQIRIYQRILSTKRNTTYERDNKRVSDYILSKIKSKYSKKKRKFIERKIRKNGLLKNKNKIKQKIRRCYKKIQNLVKELHNKSALYLVKNYERILLPEFKTQNMISEKKYNKKYFNNILIEKGIDECKKEIKIVTKKRRLNGRVKFVLSQLSHYKFKEHLKKKSIEYGSEVIIVTEEFTSKTCTNCGCQGTSYDKKRIKLCKCGVKIDRDINGARNILIKNIKKVARPKGCDTS
jgi:putative transposase